MAFTAVVPMSSPSTTFTPSPSTSRPRVDVPCPYTPARRGAGPIHVGTLRCALAPSVGPECLGRSLRARASCPAVSAPPDRIDVLVAESIRQAANRGTCRLGAAFAPLNKCSSRPGTFRRRGTSYESGGQSWGWQVDGSDADHSRNPGDLARHVPGPDRGRSDPQRAGPARRARRARRDICRRRRHEPRRGRPDQDGRRKASPSSPS